MSDEVILARETAIDLVSELEESHGMCQRLYDWLQTLQRERELSPEILRTVDRLRSKLEWAQNEVEAHVP